MLMQIATRTFKNRVHLLDNGAKETIGELLDPGLSLGKKVEHSRAHGKMERAACWCAQGSLRVAVRCSDLFEEGRTGHLAQPDF